MLEAKSNQLLTLDQTILERKRYLRDQELLITDFTDSGNLQLLGLNHDILLAKQVLRDIKADIREAAMNRKLIYEDIELAQTEINFRVISTTFVGFSAILG